MVNKLMYISYDDTQNQPFCRLQLVVDTKLNESNNQNSMKFPKVVESTNKKTCL